ncbi:hypothetical protein [Streptomyces roseolilacinus]|uniref:hypothetical protein n=1 Tax=Streptomyces roseolilacinus TaxID=66904 RepID=UPI00381E8245
MAEVAGQHRTASRPTPPRLPAQRSPYGREESYDATTSPLVRPYLVEYEQRVERARQQKRRLTLLLAADFGIDLDTRVLHGTEVAW